MTTRVAGKLGRRPALPPEQRFAIKWVHEYGALPAPAYPIDVSGGITDWGMYGNGPDPDCTLRPDGVGDCSFAARIHYQMAVAAWGHEHPPTETPNQLVAEYLQYDDGIDQGAVLAQLLLNWYQTGKIAAFAPVHPDTSDAALQAFHGLYVGVNLTPDAQDLFAAGQPWTVADGQQPDPALGHCVLQVKADGHRFNDYVTWAEDQPATLDWSDLCVEERWAVILHEDTVAPLYIDVSVLRADIDALDAA